MKHPRDKWAIQVLVTNVCQRACSNCTQCVSHAEKSFFMPADSVSEAVRCVKGFLTESPPTKQPEGKLLILMGGEVTLHPEFRGICEVMAQEVPDQNHLGLWTGVDPKKNPDWSLIEKTFGHFNVNLHDHECFHTPVLAAIQDLVPDEDEMWRMIDRCWLDEKWASAVSVNGFWFCEVACAMSNVLGGPPGLPVTPDVWDRPAEDFFYQRKWACPKCGVSMNLKGRQDREGIDDVTQSNLAALAHSPRVLNGRYVLLDGSWTEATAEPWRYLQ